MTNIISLCSYGFKNCCKYVFCERYGLYDLDKFKLNGKNDDLLFINFGQLITIM